MAHFTNVLLPAPFSPSSAWKAPAFTFTETSSSAAMAPKRLVKPISSMDGALMRYSSCNRLYDRGRVGDGAEHAALHLDHLQRGGVVALVRCAGAILEDQA